MSVEALIKAGALVLLALIAASLALPSAYAQPASRASVEAVFDSIISNLRNLLAYLESVNPSEAARYREAFEKAISKIEDAKRRTSIDPEGALRDAIKAQSEATRGAAGILKNLNVTVPPGLIVALDVKLRMVEELNATIQYLKGFNVTVDPEAEVILKATETKILELKAGLVQGALNASQVAAQLVEVNKNISKVKVLIAKSKGEWVKVQAVNAIARGLAGLTAKYGGDTLDIEKLGPEALSEVEAFLRLPEEVERVLGVKLPPAFKCNLTPLLEKHGVKLEPGFLGRLIAKLAIEDRSKLLEVIGEIRKCIVQPLIASEANLEKIPGIAREHIEKAKNVAEEARKTVKPRTVKTLEIRIEVFPRVQKGEEIVNIGTLTLGETVQVKVIEAAAGGGLKIMAGGVLTLKGEKQTYEINMPCMADVDMGCARIQVIIPGYDVPMSIEPGTYSATLKISWEARGVGVLILKIIIETTG